MTVDVGTLVLLLVGEFIDVDVTVIDECVVAVAVDEDELVLVELRVEVELLVEDEV